MGQRGSLRLADWIDENHNQLLDSYRKELHVLDRVVVHDPAPLKHTLSNAERTLAEVAARLRAEDFKVGETRQVYAWDFSQARPADRVDLGESIRAASTLFKVTLTAVTTVVAKESNASGLIAETAVALEEILATRVRVEMDGYMSHLLNQLSATQVTERQRIARDVHDRIGHTISGTQRHLELFDIYQGTDPARAAEHFRTAQHSIRESLRALQTITRDLYQVEAFKSLETAFKHYLASADTENVEVRVRINGNEDWASPHALDEVLLVLREATHNALRHASPSALIINVDITPNAIRAFVEDDGHGFDTSAQFLSPGIGVSSMRERAESLGGMLSIRSVPRHGTHVHLYVPLGGSAVDESV